MKHFFSVFVMALALFAFGSDTSADTFVRVSGNVQDVRNINADSKVDSLANFTVQVGVVATDTKAFSVVVAQTDYDNYLVGGQVDYALTDAVPWVIPRLGFAVLVDTKELKDGDIALSGVLGFDFNVSDNLWLYVEGRSWSYIAGENPSTLGVGAGVAFVF